MDVDDHPGSAVVADPAPAPAGLTRRELLRAGVVGGAALAAGAGALAGC